MQAFYVDVYDYVRVQIAFGRNWDYQAIFSTLTHVSQRPSRYLKSFERLDFTHARTFQPALVDNDPHCFADGTHQYVCA